MVDNVTPEGGIRRRSLSKRVHYRTVADETGRRSDGVKNARNIHEAASQCGESESCQWEVGRIDSEILPTMTPTSPSGGTATTASGSGGGRGGGKTPWNVLVLDN